jgi:DNA-binding NtrC family response regulator
MTGYGDIATAAASVKAGTHDFLENPFDEVRLRELISAALARIPQRSPRSRSKSSTRRWDFPRTVGMRGTIGRKDSNDRQDLMQGKDAIVGPRQFFQRE